MSEPINTGYEFPHRKASGLTVADHLRYGRGKATRLMGELLEADTNPDDVCALAIAIQMIEETEKILKSLPLDQESADRMLRTWGEEELDALIVRYQDVYRRMSEWMNGRNGSSAGIYLTQAETDELLSEEIPY